MIFSELKVLKTLFQAFPTSWKCDLYKKEWFLDLFVRKFVILHQSFLKTYLSSGLFSDPFGSHFEELKNNFEEFDLSQFGDFLTLLALNRWGHDTNTC